MQEPLCYFWDVECNGRLLRLLSHVKPKGGACRINEELYAALSFGVRVHVWKSFHIPIDFQFNFFQPGL